MTSVGKMIEQIEGLADTKDVNAWENTFIKSIAEDYREAGKSTAHLTGKQVEVIERIWKKHFA